MTKTRIDDLLNQIGTLLRRDPEYPDQDTLLHADVSDGYVAPSIFKDLGNRIVYRRENWDELCYLLLDLWKAQGDGESWAEIEYMLRGDRVEIAYTYPDEIDPLERSLDRRDRVIRRHLGEKPIDYPPLPDSWGTYDL